MDYELTSNCVTLRPTALITNMPALRVMEKLTGSQMRKIELVIARFNENLQVNAVAYDAADEMATEMGLEYA